MQKQIPIFLGLVWAEWSSRVTGSFSALLVLLGLGISIAGAFGLKIPSESIIQLATWALAAICGGQAAFSVWARERRNVTSLEDRLAPKIKLFLSSDPLNQTTGIEFAEGEKGQIIPYVQVCVEPLTNATIFNPVASIITIEHRLNTSSSFSEVIGETGLATWSRQPPQNMRLSKGKPIRFNLFWYDDHTIHDGSPIGSGSYKLDHAYAKIGQNGEYRYRVHVDGDDVVVPAEAYVSVRWRIRSHPIVTIEQVPTFVGISATCPPDCAIRAEPRG